MIKPKRTAVSRALKPSTTPLKEKGTRRPSAAYLRKMENFVAMTSNAARHSTDQKSAAHKGAPAKTSDESLKSSDDTKISHDARLFQIYGDLLIRSGKLLEATKGSGLDPADFKKPSELVRKVSDLSLGIKDSAEHRPVCMVPMPPLLKTELVAAKANLSQTTSQSKSPIESHSIIEDSVSSTNASSGSTPAKTLTNQAKANAQASAPHGSCAPVASVAQSSSSKALPSSRGVSKMHGGNSSFFKVAKPWVPFMPKARLWLNQTLQNEEVRPMSGLKVSGDDEVLVDDFFATAAIPTLSQTAGTTIAVANGASEVASTPATSSVANIAPAHRAPLPQGLSLKAANEGEETERPLTFCGGSGRIHSPMHAPASPAVRSTSKATAAFASSAASTLASAASATAGSTLGVMDEDIAFRTSYDELCYGNLMTALGPLVRSALKNKEITEIMLNENGKLFVEHLRFGMREIGSLDAASAKSIIRTLASFLDRDLPQDRPILSGRIPYHGARFEGLLPPLVSSPVFSIRSHTSLTVPLLELKQKGMLSEKQYEILREAIKAKRNIVVAGATGTGKTTLINALLNEISVLNPRERLISIEDTPELEMNIPNHVNLVTSDNVSMSMLVKSALRMRPDRIIIGEVRGSEALDLVDALSSGHSGGLTSVHAGSIDQTLRRLSLLMSRHPSAPRFIEETLIDALDLVIMVSRTPQRHISEIAEITGFKDHQFIYNLL